MFDQKTAVLFSPFMFLFVQKTKPSLLRKMIFQTSMIMVLVNLQGCTKSLDSWKIHLKFHHGSVKFKTFPIALASNDHREFQWHFR